MTRAVGPMQLQEFDLATHSQDRIEGSSGKVPDEKVKVPDEKVEKILKALLYEVIKKENGNVENNATDEERGDICNLKKQCLPKMLFFAIGDAVSFVPKPWPNAAVQNAIIEAVKNAGDSWILFDSKSEDTTTEDITKTLTGLPRILLDAVKEYDRTVFFDSAGCQLENPRSPCIKLIGIRRIKNNPSPVSVNVDQIGNTSLPKTKTKDNKSTSPQTQASPVSVNVDQIGITSLPKTKMKDNKSTSPQTQASQDSVKFADKIGIKSLPTTKMHVNKSTSPQTSAFNSFMDVKIEGIKTEDIFEKILVGLKKLMSEEWVPFHSKDLRSELRIPLLVVLVEGDRRTIKHVVRVVKTGLPVLIMKGTGKAADVILGYLEHKHVLIAWSSNSQQSPKTKREYNEESLKMYLKMNAPVEFGCMYDDTNIDELYKDMEEISKKNWLVSIFDINEHIYTQIPQIAGEAIVRAWAIQNVKQIQTITTAVLRKENPPAETEESEKESDKIEAEERRYVLTSKSTSPMSLPLYFYVIYQYLQNEKELKSENGQTLLLEALKANRCDYVRALLDQGVTFDICKIVELYNSTVKCESCNIDGGEDCLHLHWILKQTDEMYTKKLFKKGKKEDVCEKCLICCINLKDCLCYCTCPTDGTKGEETRQHARSLCKKILNYEVSGTTICMQILYLIVDCILGKCLKCTKNEKDYESPEGEELEDEDLFLWSLLANRSDIAEVLWKRTKYPLLASLISSELLHMLSQKANSVKEQILAKELMEHSNLFKKRSISMLDHLYDMDPEIAMDIIDDTVKFCDIEASPLKFAHENSMYDIIAHTSCQRWLNRVYYNGIAPDFSTFLKSFISLSFWTAPITRFALNCLTFVVVLVCYSAFVMTSIDDENYLRFEAKAWEYTTYIWAAGDCLMTLYLAVVSSDRGGDSHRSIFSRVILFFANFWNVVDFISYILLGTALIVRHAYDLSGNFAWPRRMFSLSLLMMFFRFLQVFLIHRTLGPTIIMIKEMLKDLFSFILIGLVIITGVGVFYYANLFPNHLAIFGPGTYHTWSAWRILYYPYWQIYGETFNDYLEGKDLSDCTTNSTIYNTDPSQTRCPIEEWTVPLVAAIYMLISNLLLVNLVIAKFRREEK